MVFDLSLHGAESLLTAFYHSIGGKEPGKWALRDRAAASLSEVMKISNCLRVGETETWVESVSDWQRWGTGPRGVSRGPPRWRMRVWALKTAVCVCIMGMWWQPGDRSAVLPVLPVTPASCDECKIDRAHWNSQTRGISIDSLSSAGSLFGGN